MRTEQRIAKGRGNAAKFDADSVVSPHQESLIFEKHRFFGRRLISQNISCDNYISQACGCGSHKKNARPGPRVRCHID
jgi:hypothetical protein